MRRAMLSALALALISTPGPAAPRKPKPAVGIVAPSADPFQAAGAAYEAGRFAEAQAGWERLAAQQGLTAPLCYNLGNAAFRLGHRGQAIVWYERARRLAPRDEDIRYNLTVLRSALQDEHASGWEMADRAVTPTELAWLASALLWLLGCGLGWALWAGWEWSRWRGLALIGIPAFLAVLLWLGLRTRDLAAPWAVVAQPTLEVRSGPGDQFAVGFTVPEGTRALILNQRPGWIELGVPAKSLKGWAPADSVVRI